MTRWEYFELGSGGYAITEVEPPDDAPEIIASKVFAEKRAAQIVREHNAHEGLVEAYAKEIYMNYGSAKLVRWGKLGLTEKEKYCQAALANIDTDANKEA